MKYRNLELIPIDDAGYRAFGAQRRLENMKFRKKKERSPSDLISDLVEDAVRYHIGLTDTLDENRIWKYERLKQGSYVVEYREMDFVCRLDDGALIFGEVKSSNNKRALTTARSQVGKNLKLAKRAEYTATGAIVLCGTGEEFKDGPAVLGDLPALTEASGEIAIIRIHLDHLRDGLDEKTRMEWERLQSLVEEQRAEAEKIRKERQEWRDKGVAVEDWPEHLQYPESDELEQAEIMSFGGHAEEETPMQKAMREAMAKSADNTNVEDAARDSISPPSEEESMSAPKSSVGGAHQSAQKESWVRRWVGRWIG